MKRQLKYIEYKEGGLSGPAVIAWVEYSKSGKTIKHNGKEFQSLKGQGFKANYFDVETGEEYWISGPRRDGQDRLYGERIPIQIEGDAREEYWRNIRNIPGRVNDSEA